MLYQPDGWKFGVDLSHKFDPDTLNLIPREGWEHPTFLAYGSTSLDYTIFKRGEETDYSGSIGLDLEVSRYIGTNNGIRVIPRRNQTRKPTLKEVCSLSGMHPFNFRDLLRSFGSALHQIANNPYNLALIEDELGDLNQYDPPLPKNVSSYRSRSITPRIPEGTQESQEAMGQVLQLFGKPTLIYSSKSKAPKTPRFTHPQLPQAPPKRKLLHFPKRTQ